MEKIELPGSEHAVLLLHGLQGVPAEMMPLARRLNEAGYTVRVPHFVGYGYTAGDTARSVTPWRDWRTQAVAELNDLHRRFQTVSIAGLCMGAVLALSVAESEREKISGLSLLSTTLFYDGWSIPWYRFLLPLGYHTSLRYSYAYREREPFGLKNQQLRRWVAREMENSTASVAGASKLTLPAIHEGELLIKSVKLNLPKVTTPALVIHAAEDDVSTPKSAEFVMRRIGSANVRKIMLHDSYHMITLDNERERVAAETIKFFNDLHGIPAHKRDTAKPPVVSSAPRLSLVANR